MAAYPHPQWTQVPDMVALLVRYFRLSEESARELIAELNDLRSLQSLTGYRAERATPPNDL